MKKILTFMAVAMIGLATFSGCSKSSSSSSSYSMKATINGASFSSVNCYAISSGGATSIFAYSGNSSTSTSLPSLEILLTGYNKTTGTFTIDGSSNFITIDSSAATGGADATSGTVTITSASSSTIVGTFSCTCSDGTKITGGTFTAKGY